MSKLKPAQIALANFPRPESGAVFRPEFWDKEWPLSGAVGWQSNGGPFRGHPARSLPLSLDIPFPEWSAGFSKVHFLGVFAVFASSDHESSGTLGASVQFIGDSGSEFRQDLHNGQHYTDSSKTQPICVHPGDGTSLETVGTTMVNGACVRVDVLTIDLPHNLRPRSVRFRDMGSPACFVIFDVFVELKSAEGCPFHSRGGGISLADLSSIVRLGDRVRLFRALDQLEGSLGKAQDLEEARGQALTFLSMVTAATLEMGGTRAMHRVLLEAARELDRLETAYDIAAASRRWVEHVAAGLFRDTQAPTSRLIDRALQLIERNFARNLTDTALAEQLGLSPSHFRYLFRKATGQPFHKYVVALRLEKARSLLLEQDSPVSSVARAVGFTGLSHFSRAFTQRFRVSPTSIRKQGAE